VKEKRIFGTAQKRKGIPGMGKKSRGDNLSQHTKGRKICPSRPLSTFEGRGIERKRRVVALKRGKGRFAEGRRDKAEIDGLVYVSTSGGAGQGRERYDGFKKKGRTS